MPSPGADATQQTVRMVSLSEDVLVESDRAADVLTVVASWGELSIADADPQTVAALRRMTLGPVAVANVIGTGITDATANPVTADLRRVLGLLARSVVHSLGLRDGLGPVLSVVPDGDGRPFAPLPIAPDDLLRLSRFSCIRARGGELFVESPMAPFRVVLHRRPASAIAAALPASRTVADIAAETGLGRPLLTEFLSYLLAAGVVSAGRPAEGHAEDTEPALRGWTSEDLAFHVHSRRHHLEIDDARSADTGPAPDQPRGDPARTRVALTRPRDHAPPTAPRPGPPGTAGLLIDEVAALLAESTGPEEGPVLDLYLAVDRCAGLARRVYRYDAQAHDLAELPVPEAGVAELFGAATGTSRGRWPAALLIMSVGMARVRPRVGGTPYRNTLVHVGSVHEALRRLGRDIGVGLRPVSVDHDLVGRVLGLSFPAEVAVAECAVDRHHDASDPP